MKRFLSTVLLVMGLALGATAMAADSQPSFNYLQVAAQSHDFTSSDPVGFQVVGSKTLGDVLFVTASGDRTNAQPNGSQSTYRAGLGARLEFANSAAAYGEVYALHVGANQNPNFRDVHSYGFGAEAGVRANVWGPLELRGGVASEEVAEHAGFVTYGLVGAQLNLTKSLAIVGDERYHSADQRQFDVGVRLNF